MGDQQIYLNEIVGMLEKHYSLALTQAAFSEIPNIGADMKNYLRDSTIEDVVEIVFTYTVSHQGLRETVGIIETPKNYNPKDVRSVYLCIQEDKIGLTMKSRQEEYGRLFAASAELAALRPSLDGKDCMLSIDWTYDPGDRGAIIGMVKGFFEKYLLQDTLTG